MVSIPVVEELLRCVVYLRASAYPGDLVLLLIAVVGRMRATIISHDAAFLTDVAEIMWLISSHLQSSRVVCAKLVCSTLV